MPLRYPLLCCLRLSCLACALTSSSCLKLVQVPPPGTQLQTSTVFSDDQQAETAMAGLYSQFMARPRRLFNGGITLYPGLSADEICINGGPADPREKGFAADTLSAANSLCSSLYGTGFIYINAANEILQGLSASTGVSAIQKDRLKGQAEFTRALVYFYLVNLFGDVPLVTGTDYAVNAVIPRTPSATVYGKIIADLKDAQALLPEQDTDVATNPNGRIYPAKGAATALLARTYLYVQDWANAELQATAVLADMAIYSLEANLDRVFLATSREAIWQLQPVSMSQNTSEGNIFVPPTNTSRPAYILNNALIRAFGPGDQRLAHWTHSRTIGVNVYTYPYKYKDSAGGPPYTEYNMVLRLAEQYLIRAEARAWQGNTLGAAADLNTIRGRAGLAPATATDRDSLLSDIYRERQTELFAEWGHRWLDLKRTGQADAVMRLVKTSFWKANAALYPIPFSELQSNVQLTQNPGY